MRRRLFLFARAFILALVSTLHFPQTALFADQNALSTPTDPTDANIALVEADMLQTYQYSQHPFDAEISSRFLDRYLDTLDYSHMFFLQSDIKEFDIYRTNLQVLTVQNRDISPCWVIFSRFMERARERSDYVTNLLATTKFDFTNHDRFVVNRHALPYATNMNEAKEFWRQELRCEYLEQLLEAQGIEFTGEITNASRNLGIMFSRDKAQPTDFEFFPAKLLGKDGNAIGFVNINTNGSNAMVQLRWNGSTNWNRTTNILYSANGTKIGNIHFRRLTTTASINPTVALSTNPILSSITYTDLTTNAITHFEETNISIINKTLTNQVATTTYVAHVTTNAIIHLDETNMAAINKNLTNRYVQMLDNYKELESDRVFEMYMNALAHAYDPHSDYMGHLEAENFAIQMKLSLFGIGAVLKKDRNYCEIVELKEGPAKRSGQIKEGDRIVAVAQGDTKPLSDNGTTFVPPSSDQPPHNTDPVDVIGMPLDKIVEMIRGPKGTQVTLTIIPVDAADTMRKEVTLIRDEIKLDEQAAKAMLYELPSSNSPPLKLGLIDLASFYADSDHPEKNTTSDVTRLINRLKREKVDGIILDLRRNGGGYLDEAIKLTGLFNPQGPVVQTKDPNGETFADPSPEPGPLYDGPLVVLTSVFSASASEILAGALQDYGRALMVGDHSTFGKGTVQTPQRLYSIMDSKHLEYTQDPGELKFTIKKFYRAGGVSTQLQGVLSDIALPSIDDVAEVGERFLPDAMPCDSVTPADHLEDLRLNRVKPYLAELQARSRQRVAKDKDFGYITEDITEFRKEQEDKSLSLNEVERLADQKTQAARAEARKKERMARKKSDEKIYEITLQNVDLAELQPVKVKTDSVPVIRNDDGLDDGDDEASGEEPTIDPTLEETKRILADYIELLKKGPAISQVP